MPLFTDEAEKARVIAAKGLDPNLYDFDETQMAFVPKNSPALQTEPSTSPETTSILQQKPEVKATPSLVESVGRSAAESAIPTVASLGAGAGTLALSSWLGGPATGIPITLAALALGAGAGIGASALQREVVPEDIQRQFFTTPESQQAHPIASAAGGFIPSMAAFNPIRGIQDIPTLLRGARKLPSVLGPVGTTALTTAEEQALLNAAMNTVPQAAISGYNQATSPEPFSSSRFLAETLPGLLFTRPTGIGKKMGFQDPISEAQLAAAFPKQPTIDISNQPKVSAGPSQEELLAAGGAPYKYEKNPNPKASLQQMENAPFPEGIFLRDEPKLMEQAKETMEGEGGPAPKEVEIPPKDIIEELARNREEMETRNIELEAQNKKLREGLEGRESEEGDLKAMVQEEVNKLSQEEQRELNLHLRQLARRRGFTVEEVPEIVNASGKSIAGNIVGRKIQLSTAKGSIETPAHEGAHGFLNDLIRSSRKSDAKLGLDALNAYSNSTKFKTAADWDSYVQTNPEEAYRAQTSVEELLAKDVAREGTKQSLTSLYGTKLSRMKQWLAGAKSRWKQEFGLASPEDVRTHMTQRLRGDAPYGTRLELSPIKGEGKVVIKDGSETKEKEEGNIQLLNREEVTTSRESSGEPETPSSKPKVAKLSTSKMKNKLGDPMGTTYHATSEDYAAYQDAQDRLRALRAEDPNMESPDFMTKFQEIVKDNEAVKNKYGGMPPEAPISRESEEGEIIPKRTQEEEQQARVTGQAIQEKLGEASFKAAKETEREQKRLVETLNSDLPLESVVKDTDEAFAKSNFKAQEAEAFERSDVERQSEEGEIMAFETSTEKELRQRTPFGIPIGKDGKLPGNSVLDKLPKHLTPVELQLLKDAGIEKFLRYNRHTPEEIAGWIAKNGPQVKVESYGMEGKVSEARSEMNDLIHKMEGSSSSTIKRHANSDLIDLRSTINRLEFKNDDGSYVYYRDMTDEGASMIKRLERLKTQVKNEPVDTSPRATSAYDTVSALPTSEPMPEWTKSKSGKNVQRVDVVIPHNKYIRDERGYADIDKPNKPIWQPDNLHENLPNTLGWAMIQYKTGPNGEKIAFVTEAQSRWGQEMREKKTDRTKALKTYIESVRETRKNVWQGDSHMGSIEVNAKSKEEAIQKIREEFGGPLLAEHPLLKDYNRLILKAAIDQARKEGATHIVVSDAETAMMTEGHDLRIHTEYEGGRDPDTQWPLQKEVLESEPIGGYDGNKSHKEYLKEMSAKYSVKVDDRGVGRKGDYEYHMGTYSEQASGKPDGAYEVHRIKVKDIIDQEPGMRLNYDTILPKIAEELTGSRGEKVSLGEHKNVYDNILPQIWNRPPTASEIRDSKTIRSNLIFKNPDGTPKTDVSGVMYPLQEVSAKLQREPFSLTGKRFSEEGEIAYNNDAPKYPTSYSFNRLLTSRLDKVGEKINTPTAHETTYKMRQANTERDILEGRVGNKLIAQTADYSPEEIQRVYQYRHAIDNDFPAPYSLTEHETELKTSLDKVYKEIGQMVIDSGLQVRVGDSFRKMKLRDSGYQQNTLSGTVADAWANSKPEAAEYDELFLTHAIKKGESKESAEKLLREYKEAIGNAGITPDVKFGAIRKVEGIGLPWKLVEQNFNVAARRYGGRVAGDLAFYKYLQNDPRMLKALGIRDQFGHKVETSNLAKEVSLEDVEYIGSSPEVKAALRSIYGIDVPPNPVAQSLARVVGSNIMQTGTALRNLLQLPTSIAPYYGVNLRSVMAAVSKMHERTSRAFENNAIKSSYKDFDAAGEFEGNPNKFISLADKYVSFMRKYTGRDLSDRYEGLFSYSLGEELANNWFAQAKLGDIKARSMLNRFGTTVEGGVKKKFAHSAEISSDDIARVAKEFTDVVRGSYSASGIPSAAIEGPIAPFLALSRWSIERSNNFWKDAILPIKETGDWMPLLKASFSAILTGAAIEQLNEALSGKRGTEATTKEALLSGSKSEILAKAIGLVQLGSLGGIAADALKFGSNVARGKETKFSSPISFPLASVVEDMAAKTSYASKAIGEGEDAFEVLGEYMKEILRAQSQNGRYVLNHLTDDAARKEKFRDLRIFKELSGRPVPESGAANPFLNLKGKEFKKEKDLTKAVTQGLPKAIDAIVNEANGDYEKLKRGLEGLKANSYQIFPSLSSSPQTAGEYYEFLVSTQGKEEADRRLLEFAEMSQKNKIKGSLVPRLL